MKTLHNRPGTGTTRHPADFPFDTWINDQDDLLDDDISSFDTNWIISAGDLFGKMELPATETSASYYDEAA